MDFAIGRKGEMMDDTINRRLAIKTALEFFVEFFGGAFREDDQRLLAERIEELPSTQPEINTDGDTISRQAAISIVEFECGEWKGLAQTIVNGIKKLPSAQPETNCSEFPNGSDTISRREAIDALKNRWRKTRNYEGIGDDIAEECELYLKQVPSAQPERKTGRMSNKDWIDFLCEQFDISRTSARDMLHGMMKCKKEDNFKRVFNPMQGEGEG